MIGRSTVSLQWTGCEKYIIFECNIAKLLCQQLTQKATGCNYHLIALLHEGDRLQCTHTERQPRPHQAACIELILFCAVIHWRLSTKLLLFQWVGIYFQLKDSAQYAFGRFINIPTHVWDYANIVIVTQNALTLTAPGHQQVHWWTHRHKFNFLFSHYFRQLFKMINYWPWLLQLCVHKSCLS